MTDFSVDWERRRVLPATGNSTCCLHGLLLTVFCVDCGLDLEALAAVAALRDWPCVNAEHFGLCVEGHIHSDHVAVAAGEAA